MNLNDQTFTFFDLICILLVEVKHGNYSSYQSGLITAITIVGSDYFKVYCMQRQL